MKLKPLKNKQDYSTALQRIKELWNAEINTLAGDELDVLTTLVCAYENENYKIDAPTPVEAIKFRMEQEGLSPLDLVPYLGQRSRVTEILNYQRKLSLKMIRNLSDGLKIPLDSLIQEYQLHH